MGGTAQCPRCDGAVRAPSIWHSGYTCAVHGEVVPLQPPHPADAEHLDWIARHADVPVWLPWPLPDGWLVTGTRCVRDEKHEAQAVVVAVSGPHHGPAGCSPVADVLLVPSSPAAAWERTWPDGTTWTRGRTSSRAARPPGCTPPGPRHRCGRSRPRAIAPCSSGRRAASGCGRCCGPRRPASRCSTTSSSSTCATPPTSSTSRAERCRRGCAGPDRRFPPAPERPSRHDGRASGRGGPPRRVGSCGAHRPAHALHGVRRDTIPGRRDRLRRTGRTRRRRPHRPRHELGLAGGHGRGRPTGTEVRPGRRDQLSAPWSVRAPLVLPPRPRGPRPGADADRVPDLPREPGPSHGRPARPRHGPVLGGRPGARPRAGHDRSPPHRRRPRGARCRRRP